MSLNTELAKIFDEMATILEIKGESGFKVNANSKVARTLSDFIQDISSIDDLTTIPGIGKSSAEKINEYIRTGKIKEYDELKGSIPSGLLDLMKVQGIGPKTVRQFWKEGNVVNIGTLREALNDGRLESLPRMGKKTIQNISESLEFIELTADRTRLGDALPLAESIIKTLKEVKGVSKITYAGSLRRGKETIGDIDILACTNNRELLTTNFCNLNGIAKIHAKGETKCSIRLESGMQVDLRIIDEDKFGAALMYFTGSKEHNIALRELAIKQDKKLNEYGLEPTNICESEEAIYADLGLPWIPPEVREDRGELVCKETPNLITLKDIQCDLHCHTTASDGRMSIEELAMHAIALGYHTIAVTDHSQSQTQANGLKTDRLKRHIEKIHEVNNSINEINILAGSEVDILPCGNLDYEDDLLEVLDIVVASPHSALSQSPEEATKRILKAIEHPLVNIIGHPTGRIINKRKGIELDMIAIGSASEESKTALELNANSYRLDLRDTHVRAAVECRAMISINTDAHRPEDFEQLRYGILTGRRGWLTRENCINCLSQEELQTWLGINC
ncbi:MAG: DNA polymerase/3'-5' exonuclease PolX [Phycisphaerales bacterium]|jgi:DNA polymerase (family 10)|nr:DNA polymerase/3'-5' exonuclease PolX [Phycisphaerales bacterium]